MAFPGRRKKYFMQTSFELRFARVVISFALLSAIVTGLVVFYTTFAILGEKLAQVYPQGRLVTIFKTVHIALIVNILILVPIIFYGSIRFSHRIAGPLPKIYEALRQIGNGNFEINLVLRRRDELRELADVINETARSLKERETKK